MSDKERVIYLASLPVKIQVTNYRLRVTSLEKSLYSELKSKN